MHQLSWLIPEVSEEVIVNDADEELLMILTSYLQLWELFMAYAHLQYNKVQFTFISLSCISFMFYL